MTYKGAKTGLIAAITAVSLLAFAPAAPAARADSAAKARAASKKPRSAGYIVAAPAAADAHRAAMFELAGQGYNGFRFTPSGGATGRAITVAIRARASRRPVQGVAPTAAINNINAGLQASAYSLGASVGWKHFALSGDVAKVDGGVLPEGREVADIGVSYAGRNWSTRLLLGAERATGTQASIVGSDAAMSVDLGGSYALTRNLEVNGGVRYKSQLDRNQLNSDQRRDSQAIYVGTAFRF